MRMTSQGADLFPLRSVPDLDGSVAVATPGQDLPAVGGEGHTADRARVALEPVQQTPPLQVPHEQHVVLAARTPTLAVREEGQGADNLAVRLKTMDLGHTLPATRGKGVRRPGAGRGSRR